MDHHIYTDEEVKLKVNIRKLFTDHVIWTRQFSVDLIGNLPSIDKTTERFLKNQEAIGNYIRPFFGDTAADTFISLLKEHATLAANMMKSIKDGDLNKESNFETDSVTNADNISTFLNSINPYFSKEDISDLFKTHILLLKYQFIARMNGDFNADILYFDMGLHHILTIADCLFRGIIERFFEEPTLDSYQIDYQDHDKHVGEQGPQEHIREYANQDYIVKENINIINRC